MSNHKYLPIAFALLVSLTGFGQRQKKAFEFNLANMLEQGKLKILNREISKSTDLSHPGAIHLNEQPGSGLVWIDGVSFTNGSIELDIKGRNKPQRSFVGVAFHGINDSTFEVVYFRPFNFLSNDVDKKLHMIQYVSLPEYPWHMLRKNFPGKYEKPLAHPPSPENWIHLKLVVKGVKLSAYVNGSSTPDLKVDILSKRHSGGVALWVDNQSEGDFANLKILKD